MTLPNALVTTTEYRPAASGLTFGKVSVAKADGENTGLSWLKYHWYIIGNGLVALTVNCTVAPTRFIWSVGWITICGGTQFVRTWAVSVRVA